MPRGCGCLLVFLALVILVVAVREIVSWGDSGICAMVGRYCLGIG